MKLLIISGIILLSFFITLPWACAGELRLNRYGEDGAKFGKKLDLYLMDIIDKSNESRGEQTSVFDYNMKNSTNKYSSDPQYLNNLIFKNSDKFLPSEPLPDNYDSLDMPKRERDPLSQFTTRLDSFVKNEKPDPTDKAIFNKTYSALLDKIFGLVSENTMSFDLDKLDNRDVFNIEFRPNNTLFFKLGLGSSKEAISTFEINFSPLKDTKIKLKSEENKKERKTGVELGIDF